MNNCDVLVVYFGEDIKIDDYINIHQPTVGEIMSFGEEKFWNIANLLCGNPTSMRLDLWNNGIDWNDITDFDLFCILAPSLSIESTKLIFGTLDFTLFIPFKNKEEEIVLINKENPAIQIDEKMYEKIVGYLRIMFDIFPKTEKAKGKITKETMIEEDQQKVNLAEAKKKKSKWTPSFLFPMISFALNHPGFKANADEILDIGIFRFLDSIRRIQSNEYISSFQTGMYSGMLDTSKLNLNEELNWTKDLYKDS